MRTTPRPPTAATTSPTSRSARRTTAPSPRSRSKTYANLGGVLSTIAPGIPTTLYGRMLSGAYTIPAIHCQVIGVYTNTGMVDAYRGAGRPEATYVIERAVDLVARELGARSGGGAAAQLHPAGRLPLRPGHPGRAQLRQRRLRAGARPRARDRRLRRLPRRAGAARARRGATSGSASRPTSRSAASRRRRGSGRAARAGAPASGRARTFASTSPARWW